MPKCNTHLEEEPDIPNEVELSSNGCDVTNPLGAASWPTERVYGAGDRQIDGNPPPIYSASPELTGVASRAKQFVPFAALRGFYEMIEEVTRLHNGDDAS